MPVYPVFTASVLTLSGRIEILKLADGRIKLLTWTKDASENEDKYDNVFEVELDFIMASQLCRILGICFEGVEDENKTSYA